ncbi:ABC transporter permease [Reichenbachiella agarivorans]|uniref:ABC transporter permease n=1 Tax=Reichenbachiella agarivorans TaxID=2979464 RepID=A0ABY6CRJ5_9BACT|nr:FtsX-like permease family protein [Reichenbachiella agarivorans]UXP33140.1 ABC transporter permease [Reichenbachiella agarivorans]
MEATPKNSRKFSHLWLLKMAWRDSRSSRGKLLLFTLSITIGIAALVAINSFKENLNDEINIQSKSLLGADLEVSSQQPFTEEQSGLIDSLGDERSFQTRFVSMVYFPSTGGTRLVQIRSLEGKYPYYGEIETVPTHASSTFKSGQYALVDETLMLQYNVDIGDDIKIGNLNFQIQGKLQNIPGQSGINTSVSPVVYIPNQYLQQTGLVKKGSRITYSYFYKTPDEIDTEAFDKQYEDRFEELSLRYETVQKRKENTSEAFNNTTVFLNMSAFIALLLGSIGVAGAVYSYLKEKNASVAILRCLGLSGRDAFIIYFYQVIFMGAFGSLVGTGIGTSIQFFLPELVEEVLPFSIETHFYWIIALEGLLLGLVVTVLFSLLPLLSILKVSPLSSIRSGYQLEESRQTNLILKSVLYGVITLFLFLFSYLQIQEWMQAGIFMGGLLGTFLILFVLSKGLIYLAKSIVSPKWNFLVRHGIANLHRPQNQTGLLIITIGMCTMLISIMYFSRHVLIDQITMAGREERPNMVLFDIQTHQTEEVENLVTNFDLPVVQSVPVVTMRLLEINGISKKEASLDSTLEIPDWVYNREYRVTFRDSLIDSETITDGELKPYHQDSIFVSVAEGFAEGRKWKLGDEITFNVQGAVMKTYIGSFRKIDWRRIQTNFIILFPSGVLEQAPQFHVLVTKVDNNEVSAKFQQAIVRNFPNISIIDLELILKTVEEVLTKISFVIRFMALISVITGLLVLINSIVLSKSQRVKESVLMRTIGAKARQIIAIITIEYSVLGFISAMTGIITAHLMTWVLSESLFKADYSFDGDATLYILLAVTVATLVMGLFNIRPVLKELPLTILRKEA